MQMQRTRLATKTGGGKGYGATSEATKQYVFDGGACRTFKNGDWHSPGYLHALTGL